MSLLRFKRPMPESHREIVRRVAEEMKPPTVEEDLSERYALAIALWSDAHGCTQGDYTNAQWARRRLWEGTGWCVEDAVRVWASKTRAQFARFLFITRRIGVDDD